MTPGRWPSWRAWLAVAIGGICGTELRYGLGLMFPEHSGAIPWTTLGINVVGSFVLAFLTTVWMARPGTAFWLRAGLGPGLLGSFTTFSAVAYSLDSLARSGAYLPFVGYLALSLVLGLGAAAAGWRAGHAMPGGSTLQSRGTP
ncbi:CrcB family protein [Pseudarthrobacter sp. J75]|uniref:fluoride efflux transporter FluC n=1 Tax=unclassified Pseudarthrobacter TaxID=2647000 RepID=UPI002E80BBBD|nr:MULTISPECIES: CrcB family protein [unclassified Pseudarthrobacter]MEE2521420.1 CrcB family protein [Pseudarthrobacter sp. J47]MEE2528652.1 CrcB family protein [Pseudarthrobacter sp. J75]